MRQCGFVILYFLGIFTNYVSKVDAASLRDDEKTCDTLKAVLVQCASVPANKYYCETGLSSCLDYANKATSMGCTDAEIATAASAIKQKCQDFKACTDLINEVVQCSTAAVSEAYCSTVASSCLGKANEAISKGCTGSAITEAANRIRNKCQEFAACNAYKKGLEECANMDYANEDYCETGHDPPSCIDKTYEDTPPGCMGSEIHVAVHAIIKKCHDFEMCIMLIHELQNCTFYPVNADYCSTGKDPPSCLDIANEASSKDCPETNITAAATDITYRCKELNDKCDEYLQDIKTNCAPETADADYCKENVEESCYSKLKFLNRICPDKNPGDEGVQIAKKCDEPEQCPNYLTAMFDCWNDGKLFPTSCSLDTERYKVLNCVNEAREQDEGNCNSDVIKQYNSNMVIFLNATDKFLCQGNAPQFDADCLDATISKDIIVSSFAGDMNECRPLLETIEMFKAKLGKEKCKILVDEYIVKIKKLDYCLPKRVTSEPCEKDGHGNIQLNIVIGHDIHDNNIGGSMA